MCLTRISIVTEYQPFPTSPSALCHKFVFKYEITVHSYVLKATPWLETIQEEGQFKTVEKATGIDSTIFDNTEKTHRCVMVVET